MSNLSNSYKIFSFINLTVLLLMVLLCIYPFYYIFLYSISIPGQAYKITFWPIGFTLVNYTEIFKLNSMAFAAFISVSRTVLGTLITVFCSSMFAYALTKPGLRYRKVMYRITIATMYLNAGLIPWYVVMKSYGLKDSMLLYILPSALGIFFVILIKTYIEQLPPALEESATIDGAGAATIYFKIILPLCIPVLAVIAIFSAVNQWNSWTDNFFLATNLPTLQLVLLNYLTDQTANTMALKSNLINNMANYKVTSISIRMTMTMIVTLPILAVYPFFQRYFLSGIMLGAVKG